jgi:hypothetical protein
MILASLLESAGTLLAVLTPLVAVPLTVITFYLRSLREHQVTWHADLVRRMEGTEKTMVELREHLSDFERDYTSKEEWLRESLGARRQIEQLKETAIRIETALFATRSTGGRQSGCDKDQQ